MADDLNVKGLFLAPGKITAALGGKPATIHISREAASRIAERTRARAQGGSIEMRLSHPSTGDMPIRWGRVKEVRIDPAQGRAYVASSEPYPQMAELLTDEARAKLWELGLSAFGRPVLKPREDGAYDMIDWDIRAIDIVDEGAVQGSRIVPSIPADLAAKLAAASSRLPAPGEDLVTIAPPTEGGLAEAARRASLEELNTMEKEQLEQQLKAKEQELAAKATDLAAKDHRIKELETQNKDLAAKLSEATKDAALVKDLAAKLETTTKQVKELQDERDQRLVEDDVEDAILAGKAVPAERSGLVEARTAMGATKFKAMINARPVIVPAGERGQTNREDAGATSAEQEAAKTVEKYGVDRTLDAGLHRLPTGEGQAIRGLLAAKHADHPRVQRELRAEILAAKQAARKSGGGS